MASASSFTRTRHVPFPHPDKDRDVIARKRASRDLRLGLESQQEDDRDRLTRIRMDTRDRVLDARLARSGNRALVAGMVGEAAAEVESFRQEGKDQFARQAQRAGIDQLRAHKQEYLDSLTGAQLSSKFQLDPRNRGGESPEKILQDIRQGINELKKLME